MKFCVYKILHQIMLMWCMVDKEDWVAWYTNIFYNLHASLGWIFIIRLPLVRESLSKGIRLFRVSHWDVVIIRKSCWDVISLQSEICLTQRTSKNEISPQWDTLSNRISFLRETLTNGLDCWVLILQSNL